MFEIRKTDVYEKWFISLRDRKAAARIQVRVDRLELGLYGDIKPVGQGVSELRIHYGPGYRVYFIQKGKALLLLLAGGTKQTQAQDIQTALELTKFY